MKVIRQLRKGILMLTDLTLNGFQHVSMICRSNVNSLSYGSELQQEQQKSIAYALFTVIAGH